MSEANSKILLERFINNFQLSSLQMNKKCIICGESASLMIKDTNDYYCEDCAVDNFDDISSLVRVEEQAKKLKHIVDDFENKQNEYKEPVDPNEIVDQYEEVKDRIEKEE